MKCPSLIATPTTSPWRTGRQQWTVCTTQLLVEGDPTSTVTSLTFINNIYNWNQWLVFQWHRQLKNSKRYWRFFWFCTSEVLRLYTCFFSISTWYFVAYVDGSLCNDALWSALSPTPPPRAAFVDTDTTKVTLTQAGRTPYVHIDTEAAAGG